MIDFIDNHLDEIRDALPDLSPRMMSHKLNGHLHYQGPPPHHHILTPPRPSTSSAASTSSVADKLSAFNSRVDYDCPGAFKPRDYSCKSSYGGGSSSRSPISTSPLVIQGPVPASEEAHINRLLQRNNRSYSDGFHERSPSEFFPPAPRRDSFEFPTTFDFSSSASGMDVTIKQEPVDEYSQPDSQQQQQQQQQRKGFGSNCQSDHVTSSGRNRGAGKANEPRFECQVCGDIAAGFHCGAYVCEACKKFYLRCLKSQANTNFVCPKNSTCVVTKETRSHCQYCRFNKCIQLGMYKPGKGRDEEKQLKVEFKSIQCKVCTAPSSGFHFGAITCEGCKGFFRRMLKEQLHRKFQCSGNDQCDITSATRTTCKACRFSKCISVGMKLEGTRLGRQSNSVKRLTLMNHKLKEFTDPSLKMPIVPVKKPAIQERTPPEDSLPLPAPPRMNMERRHSPPRLPPPPPLMDLYSPHQQQHQQQQEMYQHEYMRDERVPPLYRGSFSPPPPPPHAPLPPPAHSSPVIPHEPPPAHLDKPWQPYKHHRQRFSIDEPPASSMHDSYLSPLDESPLSRVRQDEVMSGKSDPPSHGRISDEDSDCSVEDRSLRTPSSPLDKTSPELPLPSVRPRSIFLEPSRMADYSSKLFGILDCINRRPDEFAQMKLDKDNLESVWAIADISFMHHVKCVVQYVRRIPGFGELCLDDQIALTQEAVYPVTLIFHARKYNLETGEHSWFINTKVEKEFVLKYFPHFGALGKHFETTGLTIKLLDLNSVEYGLLTLMAVFAPSDFVKLKDRTAMLAFQDDIMDVMMYYDRHYRGSDSRLGQMLARLPELRKANVEHSLIAAQAQAERPSMDFGAMWRDLFMSNPIVN